MPVPRAGSPCSTGPERLAAAVALGVGHAVAADLGDQALAERVDDAGADAVQAAGHLVGVVVELAAGVERGEDHLERALAGLGVDVDRECRGRCRRPTSSCRRRASVTTIRVAWPFITSSTALSTISQSR